MAWTSSPTQWPASASDELERGRVGRVDGAEQLVADAPDRLLARIAVERLRTRVPVDDRPAQLPGDDRLPRQLEQPSLPPRLGRRPLASRDVAGDLRGADDPALPVAHGRDRERDLDQRAVLAPAHGLEALDPLAAADAPEDGRHLVLPARGGEERDVAADDLPGRVAEEALGGGVPARDDAVEVLADDRVVGARDDRRQERLGEAVPGPRQVRRHPQSPVRPTGGAVRPSVGQIVTIRAAGQARPGERFRPVP